MSDLAPTGDTDMGGGDASPLGWPSTTPTSDTIGAADATSVTDSTPAVHAGGEESAAVGADTAVDQVAAPTWLSQQPPEVQKYVTELRQESAGYRDRFKPFRDAFEGYEDADRDIWLEAARTFSEDPVAVATWMREQADAILSTTGPGDQDQTTDGESEPSDQPLTRADLDRYFAERERAEAERRADAERAAENERITAEAKELGYQPNTPQYAALLYAAVHQTNGDLAAAHEALEADTKARLEAALNARAADAKKTPKTPPPTGGAVTKPAELTFEAAREASRARRNAAPIGR